MALSTAGANAAANGVASAGHYISLHFGDPGTTGANELSGGTYARQPITWPAAASGQVQYSTNIVFNVPAGSTVAYVGIWSAVSGGSFIEGGAVAVSRSYPAAGTYTLSQLTVAPA